MKKTICVPLFMSTLCLSCGPAHIAPHTDRARNYEAGHYEESDHAANPGSLWPTNSRGLFADFRAYRVGDLVTISIDENASASGDANTAMDRSSEFSAGMSGTLVGGLMAALQKLDPTASSQDLIKLMSATHFTGTGQTQRDSRVKAAIAVRVKQTMPNGDLFVEGTKVIMVNTEELHIYISGVIRPEDIGQDNAVSSSLVADAQIEFSGNGQLTDNQQQGWLTRLLSAINPF